MTPVTVFDHVRGTTRQVESVEVYLQQTANEAFREVARLEAVLKLIAESPERRATLQLWAWQAVKDG